MELAKLKTELAATYAKLAKYKDCRGDCITADPDTPSLRNVISHNPTKATVINRLYKQAGRLHWKIVKIECPEYWQESYDLAVKYNQVWALEEMV